MEIHQIPQADLLDILFEGRNKEYGAYDLRKTYNRRLLKSLLLTGTACFFLAAIYIITGWLDKSHAHDLPGVPGVVLTEVPLHPTKDPILKEKAIIKPAAPKPLPHPVATIQNVTVKIVPDNKFNPKDIPPPNADLDKARISTTTTQGAPDDGKPVAAQGTGGTSNGLDSARAAAPDDAETIVDRVDIESAYPGGLEAWRRFLVKTFRYPELAVEHEIQGTVLVRFVVDLEGNVSDVEAISGPEELRAEAIRSIRKSGKWIPASKNGHKVKSYKRQPIVFQLASE
jgi:protein TonB